MALIVRRHSNGIISLFITAVIGDTDVAINGQKLKTHDTIPGSDELVSILCNSPAKTIG